MRVEAFKATDYVQARLVNGIGFENWQLNGGVVPVLFYMEKSGTFFTVWDKEIVVLIAGWHSVWEGVCEVSLFPTQEFVDSPYRALRLVKKGLDDLVRTYRRVQLNCRKQPYFMEFALRLGFRPEGVLKKFGYDGRDHIMMSIVEESYG